MMKLFVFAIANFLLFSLSANEKKTSSKSFFLEEISYEDHIYSKSKKTEVGDLVEIDAKFRYQYNNKTFARVRFETDPIENTTDNKTSKFEFLLNHQISKFVFQLDTDLKTDDGETGGSSIGPDQDSEGTFIKYLPNKNYSISFFPYNFDGEVGHEFLTWDVTRIYYIQGTPTIFDTDMSTANASILSKTIPGIVFTFNPLPGLSAYIGFGIATYLYSADSGYNVESGTSSPQWERREDKSFKFGATYTNKKLQVAAQFVTHDKSEETGSLLESAASLRTKLFLSNFLFEAELTASKAGAAPYRLTRDGNWFSQTSPYEPLYTNKDDQHQDWLGETDFAYSFKLGIQLKKMAPYIQYKHQGEYFIYQERESAHILRTYDDDLSHGGLDIIGLGVTFKRGNFSVSPKLEWLSAKNHVFSNSADVKDSRYLSNFKKQDYLLSLKVSYQFDEKKL